MVENSCQILYGTSYLTLTEEDSDGRQYEGRASLGNNRAGDGPKYRGRGIIPIRGSHMYKVLADGISQDLESKLRRLILQIKHDLNFFG